MLIDWITCTIPAGSPAVADWIKNGLTGPWIGLDYAPGRYTRTMRCGGVSILSNAPNNESIQFSITGHGCRELTAAGLVESWPDFLARLLRAEAKFSRLDVALDDYDGILNMDDIIDCCQNGRVVCLYETILPSESRDKMTGAIIGRMVTFGKRGSESSIRVYDKALKEGVLGPWTRVEQQARDARAQALAKAITEQGGDRVPAILKGYLDFKECGTTDRRERWPTAAWWTQFLGTEQRFHLESTPRNESIEKSYHWIMKQVSRAFATVVDSGAYPTLIEDVLAQGRRKREGKAAKVMQKQ